MGCEWKGRRRRGMLREYNNIMFQNSYQNGSYFDFFDPKGTLPSTPANQDKLKPLYKTTNIQPNHKIFDK